MKVKNFIEKNHIKIYFVLVFVILVWQLLFCGTTSFKTNVFGVNADTDYEMLDGHILEFAFNISETSPKGLIIYNFRNNDIEFSDEKIFISVVDEKSGEQVQYIELDPSDEINNIYILFEEDFPINTRLKMKMWSEGFEDKGPLFAFSNTSDYSSSLWMDGVLQQVYLCSGLCYNTVSYNYLKPIIYFAAEIFIGIIIFYLTKRTKMSFFQMPKDCKKIEASKGKNIKKIVIEVVLIAFSMGIFFDYIYTYTVEIAVDQRDVDLICIADSEDSLGKITLEEGETYVQRLETDEKKLSGIGVQILEGEDSEGTIGCKLYNFTNNELLVEKKYKISTLREVKDYFENKGDYEFDESPGKFVALDFQTILSDSDEGIYKIVLYAEDLNGDNIVLATVSEQGDPLYRNEQYIGKSLSIITLHSNNAFLKWAYMGGVISLCIVLCVIYVVVCIHGVSVGKIFIILALFLGVIYCFVIPPYCVPDERTHFDSVYRISNEILGVAENPGPERIYKRSCDTEVYREATEDVTIERYRELYSSLFENSIFVDETEEELQVAYAGDAVANATVFNYLPAAVGFTIARLLHMSHIPMLIMGRLFNLFAAVLLIYVAIQKMPFGKSVIAVVSLLPMTIQQMASCSYDGIMIAGAYIFVAYSLKAIYSDGICISDVLWMLISGCFLAACKGGVYLPVLGILLLLPIGRRKINKQMIIGVFSILFPMGLVCCAQFSSRVLAVLFRSQGTSFRTGQVELYTLSYFWHNLKELVRIFQNTFFTTGDYYIKGIVGGTLGRLNISIAWYIIIAFLILLMFCALKAPNEKAYFNRYSRMYIILLCVASAVLVMLSMLLSWTSFGSEAITGVQGRYFLPFMGMLFLCIRNGRVVFAGKREDVLVVCAGFLNALALGNIVFSIL